MTNQERDEVLDLLSDMSRELDNIVSYSPIPEEKKSRLRELIDAANRWTWTRS